MTKSVLIPLAKGFEEMEAVIMIDVLRRGGLEVVVAGLDGIGPVLGSRGVSVVAEVDWNDLGERAFDAIALPGGLGGTHAMRDDGRVVAAVQRHQAAGRLTAAVCAAPLVLKAAGLVEGRRLTGHPSVGDELRAAGGQVESARLVRDGNVLTSQGPGTTMEFALAIVAELVDEKTAAEISAAMCC